LRLVCGMAYNMEGKPDKSLSDELNYMIEATAIPVPVNNPDEILNILNEDRLRLHFESELAYLRGDFEKVIDCFHKTEGDDASKIRACSLTIAAAISSGNYSLYLSMLSV